MELCAARGISNLPLVQPKHLAPKHIQYLLHHKPNFPFILKQTNFSSGTGSKYYINSSLRSTTSEETLSGTPYNTDDPERDGVMIVEDTRHENEEDHAKLNEASQEGSLVDNLLQNFKFMEDLDIKFDYEETYSILVFGGGGAVALWLAAAVVGAIDSIPLLPKVLELIGLGYTLWFSSRYLIFKENRDELIARFEQIKQQVLGSEDD